MVVCSLLGTQWSFSEQVQHQLPLAVQACLNGLSFQRFVLDCLELICVGSRAFTCDDSDKNERKNRKRVVLWSTIADANKNEEVSDRRT